MSYCSNCGGRLNDNGLCPNCGGVSQDRIAPEVKETPEVIACLKLLFSDTPLKSAERAARSQSPAIWVIFGAIYMITTVIAQISLFTSLPPGALHGLLDGHMAHTMEMAEKGAPPENVMPAFAAMSGYAAVMSLAALAVAVGMTSLLFVLAEERPSFTQSLNIVTFSALPLSVCSLISMPLALLSVPFSLGIILLGFSGTVILYYFGVQKASRFEKSPFWLFLLAMLIGEVLLALVSLLLTMLMF